MTRRYKENDDALLVKLANGWSLRIKGDGGLSQLFVFQKFEEAVDAMRQYFTSIEFKDVER
jgi:pterin-4a-carbinolamine dehydratase